MKIFSKQRIYGVMATLIAITVPAITFTSCDHFDEKLEPCPQGVELRFVYDYNMEYSNAFPSQVHCLTLFVYDSDGKYVATHTVTDESQLKNEDWRMRLPLPAGSYKFIAYGGMACDDASFAFNSAPHAGQPMQSLEVYLKPSMITSPKGQSLHPLFYGSLELTVTDEDTDMVKGTVYMMKDTNNLRIILANADGTPVREADYIYEIKASNTRFDWSNRLMPEPEQLFCPWVTGEQNAGYTEQGDDAIVAYSEFGLSRLTVENEPTLTIKRAADGRTVLGLPLSKTLLLLKSERHANMGSQEFLDRCSEWSLVLFLDSTTGGWIKTSIIINGWRVNIDDISLG